MIKYEVDGFLNDHAVCVVCGETLDWRTGCLIRQAGGTKFLVHFGCTHPGTKELEPGIKIDPTTLEDSTREENRAVRFYRGWAAYVEGDVSLARKGQPLPLGAIPGDSA